MTPPVMQPVALVTGAGRRLGKKIAEFLAARGYRLALHANASLAGAEETAGRMLADGGDALAVSADLRDEQAIREMITRVNNHFGRIDALVNNAAIWDARPLEEVTPKDVREHFEINTLGTFLCCQHVGLVMAAQAEGGAIVNVGDWAVARPYGDHAAYFAAKGSIPTLTRTFAVELAARNPRVRVNAVLPGPVLLPEAMSADERRAVADATLLKREGTADELAAAVSFLLENAFITGVCLPVDGGRRLCASADA
ncbi:MAG: SDR family NAD(P)-dependent oxidoreductase [Planctomycetota bacterium]|nr:MAG: SDR family NAD(P)-dependent oxidoreductase [Planctomycetota bacterium]